MSGLERKLKKLHQIFDPDDGDPQDSDRIVEGDGGESAQRGVRLIAGVLVLGLLAIAALASRYGVLTLATPRPAARAERRVAPEEEEHRRPVAPSYRNDLLSEVAARHREALDYYARNLEEMDDEVKDEIIRCLSDKMLGRRAISALKAMGFHAYFAVEPLAKIVETPGNPLRYLALVALLKIDPIRVCELRKAPTSLLLKVLTDEDPWARRYAVHCLRAGEDHLSPTVIQALAAAATSEDRELADAAAFAIYREGPRISVPIVLAQLAGESPESVSFGPAPAQQLEPENPPVIQSNHALTDYQMWALALGGEAARPAAFCVASSLVESFNESPIAPYTLIQMGPFAAPYLIEACEHDYEVRHDVGYVVRAWGEAAIPAYLDALRGGDARKQRTAAAFLQQLGPRAAPAVDTLVETFAEASQDAKHEHFLLVQILQTLRAIGRRAATAVPELQRIADWVAEGDSKLASDMAFRIELLTTIYSFAPTEENHSRYWTLVTTEPKDVQRHDNWLSLQFGDGVRPPHTASLLLLLETTDDSSVRHRAEKLLSDQWAPELAPRLSELVRHSSGGVRQSAARIAAAHGPAAKATTPALIEMLRGAESREESHEEFSVAAHALGKVAADEHASAALDALFAQRGLPEWRGIADFAIRSIGVRESQTGWLTGKLRSVAPMRTDPQPSLVMPVDLGERVNPLPFGVGGAPKAPLSEEFMESVMGASAQCAVTLQTMYKNKSPMRAAVPMLHSIVADFQEHDRAREWALHTIWRTTRSPLVLNLMFEHGVFPQQTMLELQERYAVDLVPKLIRDESFNAWLVLPLAGDTARASLPRLRAAMGQLEKNRLAGVAGLSAWRIEPDTAIVERLSAKLERGYDRHFIAWALGRIGPPALAAVPDLARVSYEERGELGAHAEEAIRRIRPESAAEWGIPAVAP